MSEERAATDVRLVPAAVGAWAAMGLATWGDARLTSGLALAAAGVGIVALLRRAWAVLLAAAVVAACLAAGGVRVAVRDGHPLAEAAQGRAFVSAEVVVVGEPRIVEARGNRDALRVVPVRVELLESRGRTWSGPVEATVIAKDTAAWRVVVGSRLQVSARAGPADRGERGVAILKPTGDPGVLGAPGPGLAFVERLRQGLRDACSPLWGSARALVPALVVGDVTAIPNELDEVFRITGLSHLNAVSGSNLVVLLAFAAFAATRLGVRGWWLRGMSVAVAIGFVFLCRAEPSVVRAAAMGLVMISALGSGAKGTRGLRHLALAVVVLMLVDPWLSRSAGFALSTLATAGIILLGRAWTKALAWLPGWAAEAVAIPLAAQVATQPLVTALSGQVTVSGLVANAAAGPLVGPATVMGLVATLLWWCPPLAVAAAAVAGVFASGIVFVARAGAALPGAAWEWPATPPALVVCTVACLAVVAVAPDVLRRPWLCVVLSFALVGLALRVPTPPSWPPRGWAIVACDVGQGDATVLHAGSGAAVVIDTGPDPRLLERCLAQLGIRQIPLLVLSHDHADHVGGLSAALVRPVGHVLLSGVPSANRGAILRELGGVPYAVATPGMSFDVGAVSWRTIAAPSAVPGVGDAEGESSQENDGSIIAWASTGGVSVLLTGDVEPGGQAAAAQQPLAADVLKVPHHGSGRQDASFLAAARASVALIGVGEDNDYRHPAPRTVAALQHLGMHVARTDTHGSVAVRRDEGGGLVVVTQRQG